MFVLYFIFFICLIISPIIKNGIKNGLILLSNQVIPSLYPFILITTLLNKTCHSANSYILLCISLLSGYPMGAKIISDHTFSNLTISSQDLLLLCNNPSLPYLISYVGISCLNNPIYGLLIYGCIIIGNVFTFLLKKCFHFFEHISSERKSILSICTTDDIKTETFFFDCFIILLNLSNYILLFSIVSEIIKHIYILPDLIKFLLISLCESTTGIQNISLLNIHISLKLIFITGILSFGGISVIFQTQNVIQNSHLSIKKYMTDKAISSILAMSVMYGITYLILR